MDQPRHDERALEAMRWAAGKPATRDAVAKLNRYEDKQMDRLQYNELALAAMRWAAVKPATSEAVEKVNRYVEEMQKLRGHTEPPVDRRGTYARTDMTPEQRIDAALDYVLRASGSALKHYTVPGTLKAMREAMRKAMSESYIQGSNDCHQAMMGGRK